ncbi:MAG: hypothetical protein V8S34_03445 [Lawsonibacter sp.]
MIGREEELERVIQILSRRTKNNPALMGEPGVGKTAVAEGLALAIADGTVPAHLLGRRVCALDLAAMVAGTKYRGEFEEKLQHVLGGGAPGGEHHPVHRRAAHHRGGGQRRGGHRRGQYPKARPGPGGAAGHRGHHPGRVPAAH